MAGLLDSIFGGGSGSADDPYADILTPAQRNRMQAQGLLAMAGAFAQAGMPSKWPIPFGSALGSAAAALGTGQEAGMKTAIENALSAQKVRDLRAKAGILAKLNPLFQKALEEADNPVSAPLSAGPGVSLGPPGAGVRLGGAAPAAAPAAAGGPLMMDRSLLYPEPPAAGGLLGSDVGAAGEYGVGQGAAGGGLLGPAPPERRAGLPPDQDAAYQRTLRAAAGPWRAWRQAVDAQEQADPGGTRFLPPGGGSGGSSGAPAEPDLSAGGDGWGPTFAQTASGVPARGGGQTYWTPEGLAALQPTEGRYDQIHYPSGYTREGVKSSASGAFGFIDPTWRQFASQAGVDTSVYPRAYKAPPEVQDRVAAITPVGHWTGVDAQGRPFNANAQRLATNPAFVSGEPVAGPTAAGGGEDAGWGPTFAQGGADRMIPSGPGAGGGLPITQVQYAPGGSGAPMPGAPAAGGAPALGAGGKIPGLNMTPQKLAIIDAMAEAAGLGNPFKGLLDTYYKSPGYLGDIKRQEKQIELESTGPITSATEEAKAPFIRQQMKERLGEERANALIQQGILQLPDGSLVKAPQEPGVFAQKEAATPTGEMKDYIAYTKDQQMRNQPVLSFFDWNIANKKAGAASTVLNTQEGFDAAQIKARIAVDQKAATDAGEKALAARQIMPLLDEALAIARKTPEGLAGPASATFGRMAAAFGITVPPGSSNAELLGAINQRLIPLVREPGQTAATEMDRYLAAGPALMATADGRVKIAEMTKAMGLRAIEIAKVYRQHLGAPDLYEKLAELDKPLFTDEQRKAMEAASGTGPIDKAAFDRLPSGSPFTAPDGSRRIKP